MPSIYDFNAQALLRSGFTIDLDHGAYTEKSVRGVVLMSTTDGDGVPTHYIGRGLLSPLSCYFHPVRTYINFTATRMY